MVWREPRDDFSRFLFGANRRATLQLTAMQLKIENEMMELMLPYFVAKSDECLALPLIIQ